MNINSNALAHEIAPRCRSLVSRRKPLRDLLLRAKHLFVAATDGRGMRRRLAARHRPLWGAREASGEDRPAKISPNGRRWSELRQRCR
jgi:hypothetical protein